MPRRKDIAAARQPLPPMPDSQVKKFEAAKDRQVPRKRLIKIGARVIERIARIRVQLPTSCPEVALFRTVALALLRSDP